MKILQTDVHVNDRPVSAGGAAPVDDERIGTLEKVAKSILQKMQDFDERLRAIEKSDPVIPKEIPTPIKFAAPAAGTSMDSAVLKKNLLSKMWKYLNDKPR